MAKLAWRLHQITEITHENRIAAARYAFLEQKKNAPKIAARIIRLLPEFLEALASAGERKAYVLLLEACEPEYLLEEDYKAPESPEAFKRMKPRNIKLYTYGTMRSVASWAYRQGFTVSLVTISWDEARHLKNLETEGKTMPVFREGLLERRKNDAIPEGTYLKLEW